MSEESARATQPSRKARGKQPAKEIAFDEFIARPSKVDGKLASGTEAAPRKTIPFKLRRERLTDNIEQLTEDTKAGLFNALSKAGFSEALARELIPVIEPHASRLIDNKATVEENRHRVVAFFSEAVARMKTMDETSGPAASFEAEAQYPPLTVPDGEVPRYQGKKVSGEIYEFLTRTYKHVEGGKPLSLDYLRENDGVALQAFRNERKRMPIPRELLVLTDPERGQRRAAILKRHNVDLSTSSGVSDGKRLMSELGSALYNAP